MALNSDILILAKIKKAKRGALFFINDFVAFGKPPPRYLQAGGQRSEHGNET